YCVAHPLAGRYATRQKSSIGLFLALSGHRFSVSAIQHCRPKILNHSGRKTCQISWVASLVFSVGLWRGCLAQSVAKASLSAALLSWLSAALSFSKQKQSRALKFTISHLWEAGL
uniref:hypothetical protein n=1 Tax=Vibrio parahaemolyticus TaxID=670 RepID=UPI001E333DC5